MAKCILEIKDEVNCKLSGLDIATRKFLNKTFKFSLPYARHLPSVKLGRWDGTVSFFQMGGSTYLNLLPEILPILDSRGWEIELDDKRQKFDFIFNAIDENSLQHKLWPAKHPFAGQPIILRDYQVSAINNFLENIQCLQEISTGAGKTIITAVLSSIVETYGRSIVIVPNKSLVTQTEEDYLNIGLDVGVFFGDRKEWNKTHTICTWQSLNALLKKSQSGELEKFDINDFLDGVVAVIVDECFDENAMVLTVDGYVPIKSIKAGDSIINFCEKTKEFKIDTVIEQYQNLTKSFSEKMFELEFDNGEKIKVTGNHKFLTNLGWCRADELTENHEIISNKP